jgi:hypothetical protein
VKCYCLTYQPVGTSHIYQRKEIYVTGETLYKAMFNWQCCNVVSIYEVGDAA